MSPRLPKKKPLTERDLYKLNQKATESYQKVRPLRETYNPPLETIAEEIDKLSELIFVQLDLTPITDAVIAWNDYRENGYQKKLVKRALHSTPKKYRETIIQCAKKYNPNNQSNLPPSEKKLLITFASKLMFTNPIHLTEAALAHLDNRATLPQKILLAKATKHFMPTKNITEYSQDLISRMNVDNFDYLEIVNTEFEEDIFNKEMCLKHKEFKNQTDNLGHPKFIDLIELADAINAYGLKEMLPEAYTDEYQTLLEKCSKGNGNIDDYITNIKKEDICPKTFYSRQAKQWHNEIEKELDGEMPFNLQHLALAILRHDTEQSTSADNALLSKAFERYKAEEYCGGALLESFKMQFLADLKAPFDTDAVPYVIQQPKPITYYHDDSDNSHRSDGDNESDDGSDSQNNTYHEQWGMMVTPIEER